jgi:hypothetical protein
MPSTYFNLMTHSYRAYTLLLTVSLMWILTSHRAVASPETATVDHPVATKDVATKDVATKDKSPSNSSSATPSSATPSTGRSHWKYGLLKIKSDVPGAEVWLNRELIGTLPLPGSWTLTSGTHQIELKAGEWNTTKSVQIKSGEISTISIFKVMVKEKTPSLPQPTLIEVAPGPGFSMMTAGYILLGMGTALLGYGLYSHFDATSLEEQIAQSKSKGAKNSLATEVTSQRFYSRISLSTALLCLAAGVTFGLSSQDGWLSHSARSSMSLPNTRKTEINTPQQSSSRLFLEADMNRTMIGGTFSW